MIRFIHTGDLHLDTPFKGLSKINSALAERLKDASARSFKKIADICIQERVDFLLVAGDVFDSEVKSLSAQLRFVEELKRLNKAGIPAYIIAGNHDPLVSWMKELEMPEMVYRFGPQVEHRTFMRDDRAVADIYGVSFEQKEVYVNLARSFERREDCAHFSIALLHGSPGSDYGHNPYAPFVLDDIRGKGFDYWALGHIHKKLILQQSDPAVVYPGNPQGRDFGETGERGCFLVELKHNSKPALRFIPTHTIRFEEIVIDLTGIEKPDEMKSSISNSLQQFLNADPAGFLFRIRLEGRTALHPFLNRAGEAEELVKLLNEELSQQSHFVMIDQIVVQTIPDADLDGLMKGSDFTADILKEFSELLHDKQKLDAALEAIDAEVKNGVLRKEAGVFTEDEKNEILMKAQWMLIDQLTRE
jgi:DNA repair protein SbcD/Mre11